jgi:methylated-DNA-[protein]-cysteine S-methyltransferase
MSRTLMPANTTNTLMPADTTSTAMPANTTSSAGTQYAAADAAAGTGIATGDDDEVLTRLHSRLADAARQENLLDIAYRTIDSPIGPLLLAATDTGLVRVAFAREDHDAVLAVLAEKISPRILHVPARLDAAARELDEYFGGHRTRFDLPLDFRLAAGFRREVLRHLPAIDYGTTASYAMVARMAGNPGAVRAVGTACGRNPLPVVVPCHRVVRSDGSPGGYVGGPAAKESLLRLESRP